MFAKLVDIQKLDFKEQINPKFAIGNFEEFLSFYGLDFHPTLKSRKKIWKNFLLICYLIQIIKLIIVFPLNLDKDVNYLIWLGDVTILVQSLREYVLIFCILFFSFVFQVTYLFNYDPNKQWYEIFKCLDGSLTPKSIGVNDTKILYRVLIYAKIAFKLAKIITILIISVIVISCLLLFYKNLYFKINHDNFLLFPMLIFFPTLLFPVYYLTKTLISSVICFQIICLYCFINSRYFKKSLDKLHDKINSSLTIKKSMKIKIIKLIKKQNRFSCKILKYNKFWSKFYLIMMIHILPANLICLQQALFGHISFELKIVFYIINLLDINFYASTSLLICLLIKDFKAFGNKLFQFYYIPNLNFNVNIKIKVNNI